MKDTPLLRKLLGRLPGAASPVWSDFPAAHEVDRERFSQDLARPMPKVQYVMFFTPRSGSTWVCDLATRTKRLGVLGERFNPNFLPAMTRAMNVTNLDEYCDIAPRRRASNGVFGFQITHHQLKAVFGSEEAFLARFPTPHCFWLIRQDIVLQAISLYKMQVTKVAHSPQANSTKIESREDQFVYDAREIRRWLEHILTAEMATEEMIATAGLTPLRMSYEHNVTLKPNHLLNVMGRHMGLPTMRMKPIASLHNKIATTKNATFAERFREEEAAFLRHVDVQRAPMLEKLAYYGPRRKPATIPDPGS